MLGHRKWDAENGTCGVRLPLVVFPTDRLSPGFLAFCPFKWSFSGHWREEGILGQVNCRFSPVLVCFETIVYG